MIFANKPSVTVREQQLIETRTNQNIHMFRPSAWQRQIPGKDMGTLSYAGKQAILWVKDSSGEENTKALWDPFQKWSCFHHPTSENITSWIHGTYCTFCKSLWVGKTSLLSLLSASTSVALTRHHWTHHALRIGCLRRGWVGISIVKGH